jgi:hypothetical protein
VTASPPTMDFNAFVASFATTAGVALEHARTLVTSDDTAPPAEGEPSKPEQIQHGMATARQLIDTLVMLEGKTKGNLTKEEQSLLQGALADLRMSWVKTQDLVAKQGA